uniref:Vitellogenin domain-containing protein n=1 Tax=Angiostrongylus cantonensis TaxID=6313 RepID=A0A0K0CZE1_ANGCA
MRFLLILAGACFAVHQSVDLLPLKPHNEYVFRFEGDVQSGVTVSSETSITRIQAMAHVQTPDDRTAVLKLKDIRFATGEDDSKDNFKTISDMKPRTISSKHLELLEMPVQFVYKNGMVTELHFSEKDEAWSANMKRSVINMLQINLNKVGKIDETNVDGALVARENDFFNANERTIEGDCEVAYTVLKKKDDITEVTKSVNFNKCSRRPQAKYNFRYLSECRDCKEADNFEPNTVYNYVLENNGLKKVEVMSVYTVTVENQPVMKTEVRARLSLEDVRKIRQQFESFRGKTESLIYSDEMEKQIERFYMYGDDTEVLPYERVTDKIDAIHKIIDGIREQTENNYENTVLVSRLVSILRMCSLREMSVVYSDIYMKGDERLRAIMEYSLAIAGTKNTVAHLLRHMQKEDVKTSKIVGLLKSIQELPYPSSKIVEELLRFADSGVVKRSPAVHQTTWLAIGSVMRGVVGDTMDENLLVENHRGLKQKYLNVLLKQFEKAEKIYEKVLALKSLANAGIDLSVHELEKIILNKHEELPVRMEAIDALRLLKDSMPRKLKSVLMPIYKNRLEHPELRMAALVRIMHTLPQQPVIAQIVSTMERDSNLQVAAFTYDLLSSFVKSTHTCYKELANDIRPLLSISRYQRSTRMLTSTYKFLPLFSENLMSGVNFEFATIFGRNSVWPKEIMMSLDSVFSGMWNKNLFQLGLSQQNIEKIVDKLTSKLVKLEQNSQSMSRGRRIKESLTLLKDIAKKLNIHPRMNDDKTPHAMLYLRYKEMDYAVLPVDEKAIENLLEKYITNGRLERRELDYLLNRDPEFKLHAVTFLHETLRTMPTTLGLSLTLSDMQPTIGYAEGELTIEKTPSGLRFRLNTSPSFTSTQISEMKLWNPIFEQGVKIVRFAEARLPLNFDAEVLYKNQFEFKYTVNVPSEEKSLVRMWSRPKTFFRVLCGPKYFAELEEKSIVIPKWRRVAHQSEKAINVWGIKAILRGNFINNWEKRDILLGDYDWEIVLRPSHDFPKKLRFYLNSGRIEKVRVDNVDFTYLLDQKFDVEPSKYEKFEERTRRDHIGKFARDIEGSEGYKHHLNLRVEAVDSNVERYGNAKIVTVCEENLRYCKLIVEGTFSPSEGERRDWKFFTSMQVLLPKMAKSLTELKNQAHREIQGLVQSKWGADEVNELTMKFQVEQSKEQKEWRKLADKEHNGLSAYDLLRQASLLNQVKIVANYDLTSSMKNFVRQLYDYLKGYTFWHNKVTKNNDEQGKVFLKLSVDPVSRSLLNVLLETPHERLEVKDFVVPQLYLPSIAKRSLRDIRDELVKEQVCEVKSTKVRTFDDLVFRAPLTNCFSVIAKDCSEEPRFAVLLRKIQKNAEENELKIINERQEVIKVRMVDGRLRIFVDNEEVDRDSVQSYNIEKIEDNMVRVKLEDLEVRFDGYVTKVYIGKHMSQRQCGLCGHLDEDKENEFYTPNKEYTSDIEEFHKSYLLTDKCEIEKEFSFEKKDYAVETNEERNDDWLSAYDDENTSNDSKDFGEEPLKTTHVMEFPHRVCFSLEPVRKCRRNEKMDDVVEKKVRFTCLPRSSHETRQLLHKARTSVLDLNDYPVSFVENLRVPTACVVY